MIFILLLSGCVELQSVNIEEPDDEDIITRTDESTETEKDKITLSLGHVLAEDDITHESTVLLAELANEYSDGELEINIYPNSQLGGERELVEGVGMDAVDIGLVANAAVTNFVPSLVYWDFPYLIEDIEHMKNVENSDAMNHLNSELRNNGYINLALQHGGFRQISNSVRPLEEVEDFHGINIRLLESRIMIDTFETLEGTRTSNMSFSELYSGLQQGVVDGQDNPVNLIYNMRFYEVQDYLSITDHFFTTRYYLMNEDRFNQLSGKQQDALIRASEEAMEYLKEELYDNQEEILQDLEEEGMEINTVSKEFKNEFRSIAEKEVYPKYYSQIGNGDELDGKKIVKEIIDLRD